MPGRLRAKTLCKVEFVDVLETVVSQKERNERNESIVAGVLRNYLKGSLGDEITEGFMLRAKGFMLPGISSTGLQPSDKQLMVVLWLLTAKG